MIDQKLNEAAGWILGWKPGQKCEQPLGLCQHYNFREAAGGSNIRILAHDIPAPDFNDWRVAGAALGVLSKEGPDEPHIDENTGEKYIMPGERHYVELWFDGAFWYCRTDSWAETYRHHEAQESIALACAKLGGQQ